ncbi:hypothetical protein SUGI_0715270 [Cryptomeria japonica]|nr:hypothetical protein SUGI_0715270 [Cryptomeria japonica]
MEAIFVGAVVGVAFQEASAAVKKGIPYIIRVFSNSACKKLKETLNGLKPAVDEMWELSLESSSEAWLRSIEDFRAKLADGLRLVEDCEKTSFRKLHKKFRYAKKIQNMEKYIGDFINTNILPHIALDVMKLANDSKRLKILTEDVKQIACKIDAHTQENSLFRRKIIENSGANVEQHEWSLCVPNMPSFLVGLDSFVEQLKELLLDINVSLVGITGMSGMGKSTLASALCHHNQIKEHFKKRVIYFTVSKSPKILDIIENMCEIIVGCPKPGFKNIEEARNQLQYQISSRRSQPTLVVLDDVCSRSNLQKLLFEGEYYKTLVTTRDVNVICKQHNARVYQLPCLQEDHALSLFCHYSFGQLTIPASHDKELVKQVQAECKGLPLALQVIGSSLRDEPTPVWQIAKNKLSRGETISSYHEEELHERLKTTSIDVLEDDAKQCFLDLAAFPQGRTISANALLDIWVYVRGMDWDDAFMVLWEFADRSLLELKRDPWSPGITHGCAYGLSFSQHDVMRDLALYLLKQDNIIHCSRLCMPEKHDRIPSKWHTVDTSKVQIVSIHTGTLDENQWPQMEFPEVEALLLYFTASRYNIPKFLHTMKKLKVLIIHNYSTRRATLNGLDAFSALSQLKTLQLESDLEELPKGICSSTSLKKLSVTNCHRLAKLPDELGNLSVLEGFPDGFHKLPSLKKLDLRECCKLRQFSKTLSKLSSLKHVICDKNNEQQLTYICKVNSTSNLTVEVVEEAFSLDWLH